MTTVTRLSVTPVKGTRLSSTMAATVAAASDARMGSRGASQSKAPAPATGSNRASRPNVRSRGCRRPYHRLSSGRVPKMLAVSAAASAALNWMYVPTANPCLNTNHHATNATSPNARRDSGGALGSGRS